ncbi:PTS mannitol transporter subunit IICBA [Sporolactobacillus sp. THM7-7]|nr:PTS mannitol transporter subunit IICBA [Sporolactobacillus sp. THM7-7]
MSENKRIKVGVQKFGNFLSSMILPNIAAFIAWGLITAIFIPTGWWPNESLAKLVDPTVKYLLPILIGYTGGKLIYDHRGGVVGAIGTAGIIIGTDIPMFLGAMIMGPLGGYLIKKFDKLIEGKIKTGFEMLVNNFSAGILGGLLAVFAFVGVGPLVDALSGILAAGVGWLVHTGILPVASLFIEPGKVLFLNNAINHGILTPIGIEQAREYGKSVLFLLEANPGPGMGILLAYCLFGKGNAKKSAPGAAVIHFFGGIHEIYFPYILMKPFLFVAAILGGAAGIFTVILLNGGLLAPASPGSIFAILAATPRSFANYAANMADVLVSVTVSFLTAALVLKADKSENDDLESATRKMENMKGKKSRVAGVLGSAPSLVPGQVKKIVFACDAGMGSSAMGASLLKKKVQDAGLDILVTNSAVSSIPSDAQIVITQTELTHRAKEKAPNVTHVSVDNFLSSGTYDRLIDELKRKRGSGSAQSEPEDNWDWSDASVLKKENIFLNQSFSSKEEAIRFAGDALVRGKYVKSSYVPAMIERDRDMSTYMGNEIAIPHGTEEAKKEVIASGVVIVQIPDGVDFDGNTVRLVFGIAGENNNHLSILSKIALACAEIDNVTKMVQAETADELLAVIHASIRDSA